jgi:hypothetical protein
MISDFYDVEIVLRFSQKLEPSSASPVSSPQNSTRHDPLLEMDSPSQHPLRTNHLPRLTRNPLCGNATCNSQALERRLRAMVVVLPLQHINMQRNSGSLAERLQPMVDHLRAELADLGVFEAKVADEEGPRRDVEDGARGRFVERGTRVAKAADAFAIAQGAGEGFP